MKWLVEEILFLVRETKSRIASTQCEHCTTCPFLLIWIKEGKFGTAILVGLETVLSLANFSLRISVLILSLIFLLSPDVLYQSRTRHNLVPSSHKHDSFFQWCSHKPQNKMRWGVPHRQNCSGDLQSNSKVGLYYTQICIAKIQQQNLSKTFDLSKILRYGTNFKFCNWTRAAVLWKVAHNVWRKTMSSS